MLDSISLCKRDRNVLLQLYRRTSDPQLRLRAHILLLLDQGQSWAVIATVLFTNTSTINRWRQRFREAGLQAVVGPRPRRASLWPAWWATLVIGWVTLRCPTDFGFVRSRWSCDTVILLLREEHGMRVSRETVAPTRTRPESPAAAPETAENPGRAAAFAGR